ncbi:MAG: hypothetical protein AAF213_06295 [Pseudomonadota bacterium]
MIGLISVVNSEAKSADSLHLIPPDSPDYIGSFSRFDLPNCRLLDIGPPKLRDLIIIEPPREGTIIDGGLTNVQKSENCWLPARVLIYRSNKDFVGPDRVVIKDPVTGKLIAKTYEKTSGFRALNIEGMENDAVYPDYP